MHLLLRRSSFSNLLLRLQQHRHGARPGWNWQDHRREAWNGRVASLL